MGNAMLEIAGLAMTRLDPEHAAEKEAALRLLPIDRFPRVAEMVASRIADQGTDGTEFTSAWTSCSPGSRRSSGAAPAPGAPAVGPQTAR